MRRGAAFAMLIGLSGCTLLVSTSGLSGEPAAEGSSETGADSTVEAASPETSASDAPITTDSGGSAYTAAVLADAPVAYLKLDDASGTTARSYIQGGPNAIYMGGITLGAAGATADGNAAATFDNTGWLDFGEVFPFNGTAPYSLEIWMKPTLVDDSTRFVFDRGPAQAPPGEGYTVYFGGTYLLAARTTAAAGEFGYASAMGPPKANMWTHLVVTYDGTNRLYLDSILVGSQPAGAIGISAGRLAIGNLARGQFNKFVGSFDEVAIYDKALSGARIGAHFVAAQAR
jgi:hypothetical protein